MAETPEELSRAEKMRWRTLFNNAPASGLGKGGMRSAPATMDDLFDITTSLVEYLKWMMSREVEANRKLADIEEEIEFAGKLLARMGLGNSGATTEVRAAFKAVEAAVMIRPQVTREDIHEIAKKHGVEL
jgi:hypothetical protein